MLDEYAMSGQIPANQDLALNLLPVTFSRTEIAGYVLDFVSKDQLHSLQDTYQGAFFLYRSGRSIQAVPMRKGVDLSDATPQTFTLTRDSSLFYRLLEEGIRTQLRKNAPSLTIPEHGRLLIFADAEDQDLTRTAWAQRRAQFAGLNFLHVYRRYHLAASQLKRDRDEEPISGLLIAVSTNWRLGASIMELTSRGVDVTGCYVVPLTFSAERNLGKHSLGRVARVVDSEVYLVDAREQEILPADQYTIEASLQNATRCAMAILGAQGSQAMALLRKGVGKTTGASGQMERIQAIARSLASGRISCSAELSARISSDIVKTGSLKRRTTLAFEEPKYVLRYGRPAVSGPVAPALSSQGPFDQDSFKKTTPFVAIITPKEYVGRVEQFLRVWRDGGSTLPYYKGFIAQYRLRGCEFHIVDFEQSSGRPDDDYRHACQRALQESRDLVRRYDLAFVVIEERHRLLGSYDPYLVAKAVLMNGEVPVQEIEIETINQPLQQQRYVLNNIGLASYTKMGGTPWLLASAKGQGIAHELIVGLGFVTTGSDRLQGQERYVGITTLFNYDGVYQISTLSKECSFDEYSRALQSTLLEGLKYVSIQNGWQSGDRVRLVFHSAKPLKNLEIEAVKHLVRDNLSEYVVDFAFLIIGDKHPWSTYDPGSGGYRDKYGNVRGLFVPKRGTALLVDDQRALLSITGPTELKSPHDGCPDPLQVRLNGASTFTDIEFLTHQVFDFTYMSWKTFNPLPKPITIAYSEAIASLLGRLRTVKNWNADVFQTSQLQSSLWFLIMEIFNATLQRALAKLKEAVMPLMTHPNLDGLLALHFDVSSRLQRETASHVYTDPARWLRDNETTLDQAPSLAVFGMLLSERAKERSAYPADQTTNAFTDFHIGK